MRASDTQAVFVRERRTEFPRASLWTSRCAVSRYTTQEQRIQKLFAELIVCEPVFTFPIPSYLQQIDEERSGVAELDVRTAVAPEYPIRLIVLQVHRRRQS